MGKWAPAHLQRPSFLLHSLLLTPYSSLLQKTLNWIVSFPGLRRISSSRAERAWEVRRASLTSEK